MRDSELLRRLDGGRRPLLCVLFEPGTTAPVARAHLEVGQKGVPGRYLTLRVEGVERVPPVIDDPLFHDGPPDELCVPVPAIGLLAAMADFGRDGHLACSLDDHTAATLDAMDIEHIGIEDALDQLDDEGRAAIEWKMALDRDLQLKWTITWWGHTLLAASGLESCGIVREYRL